MNITHKNPASGIKITWISIFSNILLAIAKCILGVIANSKALIADGFHSIFDISSDLIALFGLKIAVRPEDKNHLYGHHKFSSLCTLMISLSLVFFCGLLIYNSIHGWWHHEPIVPTALSLFVTGLSVLIKEALFWRTRFIAQKIGSRLLMANAWHHRADSLSSILVFCTLAIIIFGGEKYAFLDSLMGIGLAIYLGYQAIRLGKSGIDDLLDTAPKITVINDIREHILETPGALGYHKFRVRMVGDLLEVDLHLQVDGQTTVEAGHKIASEVKQNILHQHGEVLDVLVHVEPASERHLQPRGIHYKENQ